MTAYPASGNTATRRTGRACPAPSAATTASTSGPSLRDSGRWSSPTPAACTALGIEVEADEGDMQNYDDRGEPVSIGRL